MATGQEGATTAMSGIGVYPVAVVAGLSDQPYCTSVGSLEVRGLPAQSCVAEGQAATQTLLFVQVTSETALGLQIMDAPTDAAAPVHRLADSLGMFLDALSNHSALG